MREHKFRAWDKRKKCFRKDWHTSIMGNGQIIDSGSYGYEKLNNVIIQQFTGLKAKGKEIWEGDIVELSHYSIRKGKWVKFRDKIIFYDGAFRFNKDRYDWPLEKEVIKDWNVKVIGNIYQNKNLLKE